MAAEAILGRFAGSPMTGFRRDKSRRKLFACWAMPPPVDRFKLKILGNIEIGACSLIAAGPVVLHPVPPNTTMAAVPARAVGTAGCAEPSRSMNQILSQLASDSFTCTI